MKKQENLQTKLAVINALMQLDEPLDEAVKHWIIDVLSEAQLALEKA